MDISLKGKNALVCGSSAGIGKAAAMELAELGATITLIARNEMKLQKAIRELDNSAGQTHNYLIADFSDAEQVHRTVSDYVRFEEKQFHILVNNTGGPAAGAITTAQIQDFLQAYNNHLVCSHLLAQTVLPHMKEQGWGRIINVISTSVKEPIPGLGVSNTTRGAMAGWAKTWAQEVGQYGITVNNVLPGATLTQRWEDILESKAKKGNVEKSVVEEQYKNITPVRRFAEPREIGAAIAFLASPAASYINGINLPVDGGRMKSM